MPETQDLTTTTTPMHLTVDPYWDLVEVLAYGTVCDTIGSERFHALVEDRVAYVLDEPLSEVVGFVVKGYAELDPLELGVPELWDGPRFGVPVLGLRGATLGEVMLAIRGRFAPGEPTADAMHFHMAMAAETAEEALSQWQLALEAGDMKAHYTLCELGRYRNAYDHLRHYTELVAGNAWAWCWLGQACAGCELFGEARAAYARAIELDDDEETGAAELLAELDEDAAPSDPQFLRLSDGRSFFLGTGQEVDTAFAQIVACTGGSSGGGRWSRLFGLQPELYVEASDLGSRDLRAGSQRPAHQCWPRTRRRGSAAPGPVRVAVARPPTAPAIPTLHDTWVGWEMGDVMRQTGVVDERGRLLIPGPLRRALLLNPGEPVVLESDGNELRIFSARRQRAAVAQRLRGSVKAGATADDLIADRRRDAAREADER